MLNDKNLIPALSKKYFVLRFSFSSVAGAAQEILQ
jgi:hypothetical protein